MKKVLIVTDFSPASENAGHYAINLFGKASVGSLVHYVFLHCYEPVATVSPHSGVYVTTSASMIEQGISTQRDRLSRFVNNFKSKYPATSISENLEIGPTVPTIREMSNKWNIDVLVAGTTGLRGIDRIMMGSTSISLAQAAPCPVLLIPEATEIAGPKKIVLATNFNPFKEGEILGELRDLAGQFDSEVMLLRVQAKKSESLQSDNQIMTLHQYFKGWNFDHHDLNDKDVSRGISDFTKGYGAHMLALVGQQRNLLQRIFHKSVRKKILSGLDIPLLILHPSYPKAEDEESPPGKSL